MQKGGLMPSEITAQTFDEGVLSSAEPVVVDFWAPWCGPCRAVAPVLERIAKERAGELRIVKVNVDNEPELAARYGISSIPTILLFKDGEPVASAVGAQGKAQLERSLGLAPGPSPVAQRSQTVPARLLARLRGER